MGRETNRRGIDFATIQVSFIGEDLRVTFFTNHAAHRAEPLWRQFRD